MSKQEEIREGVALKLKGLMPGIILDYVNNNEAIKLQDCKLVASFLLSYLHSQGVVIKVGYPVDYIDGNTGKKYTKIDGMFTQIADVATIPLIEEGKK